ncbi:MAG TPA: bifunctional DNA-formamidopyrimidine glycosylase/DNA-(apurinic or apyrimidinic site) lyase [Planctomycetaceae bacterium]|nr:bifunctional DNA-formamidopyrimidine glycosylase/DNA-(apurinic or apyrimidinic site) lyase [Planctomycetaceae bacterium]
MPELPEVETMVRGIRPFVEGRRITAFRRCPCRCRPIVLEPAPATIARRVVGQKVLAVRRRAKRVVLELSGGSAFVIEPRMTGLVLLADPPDRAHLRVEWSFEGKRAHNLLWFWDQRGLGTVRLLSPAELTEALGESRLGPDALEMDEARWRARCARTARPIKVALLDQKLVAGIGNLYASEILHRARIDPQRPADRLQRGHVARLTAAALEILEDAIRYEGSTLGDGTYRNALNQAGSYQNAHQVYDREGERCLTCGRGTIRRIVQAQRSTFYCSQCQR